MFSAPSPSAGQGSGLSKPARSTLALTVASAFERSSVRPPMCQSGDAAHLL